jgi:hypothetical protein
MNWLRKRLFFSVFRIGNVTYMLAGLILWNTQAMKACNEYEYGAVDGVAPPLRNCFNKAHPPEGVAAQWYFPTAH